MIDQRRLKFIEAALSFSPVPTDTFGWWHEPALRLLTEEESDRLVTLFEQIADHNNHIITKRMACLQEPDVALLETFITKSAEGMRAMKDQGFSSFLSMNLAEKVAA